jgi:hypothetical protein
MTKPHFRFSNVKFVLEGLNTETGQLQRIEFPPMPEAEVSLSIYNDFEAVFNGPQVGLIPRGLGQLKVDMRKPGFPDGGK